MSAEGVFSPHAGKGDSDKDKSEREERKDKERKKGNERGKAIGIQGQKDGGSPIQMPVHKSEEKSETEGIQNQDKTGTKGNKQKPPPYEKKRTPDMGVRPGAQEE
ncbi:hypothetical protein FSP39_007575 [Pinctada imbricata]|uniref:Uncharacterized protein n=1 Tax=Pinctada imbricata TaxID=66713 RepID=A0AA89BUA3_PINIB|nr:hypothetical protein FSP39_007575 [Pinctada imbricata]